MQTLFISDLHLDESRPDKVELFISFLKSLSPDVNQVFILGDLFEFWNGDDDLNDAHQAIINALETLSGREIKLFIMRGNRDFLLGKKFAQLTNSTILEDPTTIKLFDKNILIMHGDLLCSDDISYQRLRQITNNSFLQKLFLLLPLSFRKRISSRGRKISQSQNKNKKNEIMDVNSTTVKQYCLKFNADELIHGHTHRQAMHEVDLEDKTIKRIVLGDWYQEDCVLVYEKEHQEFLRIKDYIRNY